MKLKIDKKRLKSTKVIREFGVNDLIKYKEKIKKNILVFEEAIEKEKTEMKRVDGMIASLKKDIKEIDEVL
ncbi:MAG: hypothetical protein UR39_C0011G0026 [Candidatus Woesebacteria bacterium GW2011_GWA1_33_30]|uniref:Uncharacterized protein n=1 Tax=Candidatus Woesebacteria bacterium GW2011_GWA2_33_28 TaxID=1618561 RepID=A0A0F9ZQG6_9BACT|nr:MAG: hypothetical protein UR38_C0011G0024 [Candidatus Woesebacteria bacterium GW2011_GWA2_33_28]KKP47074.1 MAG: hypothetical protein UR39_C0011G0026 [Candidatus Woesebacteria bacterium GW2011_GWA1_33_30]KKP48688.1 MAG: hypothetical protein UR40_C0012G0024 [Microgenomates group bacterium GW2011_GWC1_33_32]KKP51397.1 MAG: hypothetical protein UR44_C0011G0024 [Candidatus Woesebacteria bacterium GW2011_GWB1_33_38]KKP57436.1 MAG: hypothetical protein UR48_C0017G0009 [Microgenomates group bacteriu